MQKIFRGIIGGLLFGVINRILGILIYGGLFKNNVQEVAHLFRPLSDPLMTMGVPIIDLLIGLLISAYFVMVQQSVPGKGLKKGIMYAVVLFFVGRFGGELMSYAMYPYGLNLLFAGILHGLTTAIIGGATLAYVYGRTLTQKVT